MSPPATSSPSTRIGVSTADGCADRGSVSLWLVIFAFTAITLLVLVVDGGQTMNAKSRAADIAEQAARAAADDVNVGQLRGGTIGLGGDACDLKQGPAAQLVASYAAGVPGATGTPAAIIRLRAGTFSPIASTAWGSGPIKTSPISVMRRAKPVFSLKKP